MPANSAILHTEAYCDFVRARAHLIQICIQKGEPIEAVAALLGMDPGLVHRIALAPSPGSLWDDPHPQRLDIL
jgi:hypothetical protein